MAHWDATFSTRCGTPSCRRRASTIPFISTLDDAWYRIEKSGSRFARPAYARAMREVLVKRIIESAQRGEMDKLKLAADTVKFLAANYMDDNAGRATAAKHADSEANTPRLRSSRAPKLVRGELFFQAYMSVGLEAAHHAREPDSPPR